MAAAGGAQAGMLTAPGPNPSWTDMQKFEWYLGYMARAAQTCGTYTESAVLSRLARMTPYGDIGLGSVSGDGFAGPVCGRINNEAKELAADAQKIEEYIEATYNCTGEGCFGQSLSDWKFHDCADMLRAQLTMRGIGLRKVREITINDQRQARVRLHSCQGSLYVEMSKSCKVKKEYTRGDCEVAGVDAY